MKKFFYLTLFGIFFIPLSSTIPIPGTDLWYSQYLGLFALFCLVISLKLWEFNKILAVFTLYCLFSSMFVSNQHPKAIISVIQIYFGCLAMYGISTFDADRRKLLCRAIILLVLLQGGMILLQKFNLDSIFNNIANPMIDDTVAFCGSKNQAGLFFATATPLVLHIFPYFLPLILAGLWFAKTTTAMVAAFIGVGCYLFTFQRKIFGIFVLFLLFVAPFIYPKFDTLPKVEFTDRLNVVKYSIMQVNKGEALMRNENMIKRVRCNPLFGFGLGNFTRISPYTQVDYLTRTHADTHRYFHAHNDYVETYFDLGQVGFGLLVLLLGHFFWGFIKIKKTKTLIMLFLCIFVYMLCAGGIFTIQIPVSAYLFILIYGLYMGEYRDIQEAVKRGVSYGESK